MNVKSVDFISALSEYLSKGSVPMLLSKYLRDFARTFMATVFVHVEDLVLRASLVTRMLKL